MSLTRYLYIAFFFCSTLSFGQLTDFNFNATAVNETCTNNGVIEMFVSNVTPGAEIIYQLYLAPDFENPLAETTASSFAGLAGGIYRVVANQSNDGIANSKQIDLTISNLIEIIDFQISDATGTNCDTDASLIVTVLSGNPVLYEIIFGPEIRPRQASNVFSGLLSGTYTVRVFDDCGDALTKTYTFNIIKNDLLIGAPVLPEVYNSCTSIGITNQISASSGASILYPLIVNYTVFAPDGLIAQTFTQNIDFGPSDVVELIQNTTLFGSELFDINIEIIDNCNTVFTEQFEINPNPKVSFQQESGECGDLFFSINVINYFPPFTLNFTQPVEFNPLSFNEIYPGPYAQGPVTFGSIENPIPFGDYSFSLQDNCGRTADTNFSLILKILEPQAAASNNGCASVFGNVRISIPDRKIVSIVMTEAPNAYSGALPDTVSDGVDGNGVYINTNLPIGIYTFVIVDDCGDTYEKEVTVPAFVFGPLVALARPDCSPTSGAIRLSTTNGKLVTVKITAAPPTFLFPLPYDASFNINANGLMYMADLPAGMYSFEAVDSCGFELENTIQINGYTSNSDGFQLTRKCGSFDITIEDNDESITGKTFWLQKYAPETNSWGHPNTGAAFVEGNIPTSSSAREIGNFSTVFNIFLIGDFRIVKVYQSFNNGNPDAKCADLYVEFTVAPELIILGAYNLSCNDGSGLNSVVLDVIGVQPFNYKVMDPFELDNGESNTFSELAEGVYIFQVSDSCGNIKNITVEIGTLLPLVSANEPQSMLVCRNDGVQFGVFPLVNQTPQVLGNQNPNYYDVTYHLTQEEADSGQNPLPDGYTNFSNPQIIYVRVQHQTITVCYATTSFKIFAGIKPILTPIVPLFICEGFTTKLTAQSGFSAYEWSTGETTPSIIVNSAGTYTLTVKNQYEDFSCDTSVNYEVIASSRAEIQSVDTSDWSSSNNTVVVSVRGAGTYQYSLDDVFYQTSNTFDNLRPGIYTVYVRDENGCENVTEEFTLLNYPKYFTPNADGYNDTWQIQFSAAEPDLNVDIFDRFGKFIIRLKGGQKGWDGTYNGNNLPATDYWFLVVREDGKIYTGHFSLKR
jgi:gliding motility-associated-like protein